MKILMAILLLAALIVVSSMAIESANDARASIEIARETTKQTGIEWDGRINIAQIEAERDVDIAGIHRDEVIWSSWSWNIFSVIRGLMWVLGVLCVVWVLVRVTGFQLA